MSRGRELRERHQLTNDGLRDLDCRNQTVLVELGGGIREVEVSRCPV